MSSFTYQFLLILKSPLLLLFFFELKIYHTEKPIALQEGKVLDIIEEGPLRVAIKARWDVIGQASSIEQTIYLTATSPIIEFNTEVK